jgi:excisionase family DNA binding protein
MTTEAAPNLDPMLKIPDVATRLGVSTTTVYDLTTKGSIPMFKLGGQWVIRASSLESWLSEQEQASAASDTDTDTDTGE